jgi:hypothetical protein
MRLVHASPVRQAEAGAVAVMAAVGEAAATEAAVVTVAAAARAVKDAAANFEDTFWKAPGRKIRRFLFWQSSDWLRLCRPRDAKFD